MALAVLVVGLLAIALIMLLVALVVAAITLLLLVVCAIVAIALALAVILALAVVIVTRHDALQLRIYSQENTEEEESIGSSGQGNTGTLGRASSGDCHSVLTAGEGQVEVVGRGCLRLHHTRALYATRPGVLLTGGVAWLKGRSCPIRNTLGAIAAELKQRSWAAGSSGLAGGVRVEWLTRRSTSH